MGIVIGEHGLIKERKRGEIMFGTVLLGHTHTHTRTVCMRTSHTQTHTYTALQASETVCHYVLWLWSQIRPNGFLN